MSTIYRFEDTNGVPAILHACGVRLDAGNSIRGLSSRKVLKLIDDDVDYYSKLGVDDIVSVFDADPCTGDKVSVLSVEAFNTRVGQMRRKLDNFTYPVSCRYLLTVYAAETIGLMQYMDTAGGFNPELLVNKFDLYRFQVVALSVLSNCKKVKRFEDWLDPDRLLFNMRRYQDLLVFNHRLVNWILTGECVGMTEYEVISDLIRLSEVINTLTYVDVELKLNGFTLSTADPVDVFTETRRKYFDRR